MIERKVLKIFHESECIIERLNFSVRTYNCLKKNNINTLKELLEVTDEKLMRFRNLGAKSFEEVKNIIIQIRSGNSVFDDKECCSNKLIHNSKLSILEINAERDKKILKVLFKCGNNGLVDDIKIEDMRLSVRSYNALKSCGYGYASQLIRLNIMSLNAIKNLGQKSKDEIMDTLKSLLYIVYDEKYTEEIESVSKICNALIEEYRQSDFDYDEEVLQCNIYTSVKSNAYSNIDMYKNSDELLATKEFLGQVYSNFYLKELLKENILKFIKNKNCFVDINEISRIIPRHLSNSDIIKGAINDLVKSSIVELVEGRYRIWYPRLSDYLNSLMNERERIILLNRFGGKTLEETGSELGITRERVRQLERRAIRKIPRIRVDDYQGSFEKYNWPSELFKNVYCTTEIEYGYLNSKYNKGELSHELILEDTCIPIEIRLKVEKVILKDYIFIGNSRIKKDRNEILDYISRNYCKDEVSINDVADLYYMFLEDYGLNQDNEMIYLDRYLEAKLAGSKKVLWKYGKKLRYFDTTEFNQQSIVESLNLREFQDVEYSTLKFFKEYKEIMNEWDIRDEYELHNLMKKTFDEENKFDIRLTRMPNIEFGKPSRDMQIFNLLLEKAPIEYYELAKIYENIYGVKEQTVAANYFKCIDEFYHDGVFSIDSEPLIGEEFDKMKEKLVDDIYIIKDVREIYINLFPYGDIKYINPYNLKRLGFRVNASVIYSDKYTSLEDYFRKIILQDDIFDATVLDSRITCSQTFYHVLTILKEEFEIIEFSPNKFVRIRRLEAAGMGRNLLQEFINEAYDFVGDELFTIKYLRINGFEHSLDELGFDDWFYSSLLKCDCRFKFRRVDKTILFQKGSKAITLNDLIEYVVCKYRSINIYDLVDEINSEYGIKIDIRKIPYMSKEKDLYFNAIMEKVYIDYDEYFEEV